MPIAIARGFAKPNTAAILAEISQVIKDAPLFQGRVGTSGKLRYSMTNCGKYGWVSTSEGYTKINPQTGKRWPRVPPIIGQIMVKAGQQFYPEFRLETVLINYYTANLNNPQKPLLGFHQDTSERNKQAPIISLTFGEGTFIVGGKVDATGRLSKDQIRKLNKTLTTEYTLSDGDLLVMYGEERMCFHAAGEVRSDLRINLTGRMVDPISESDKPIIISMVGMERSTKLPESATTAIRQILSNQRKPSSEVLLLNRPGGDSLIRDALRKLNYSPVYLYQTNLEEDVPSSNRFISDTLQTTIAEILEQSDYNLILTNGTEQITKFAIDYLNYINKNSNILTITDEETDPEPPTRTEPEPPTETQPEPEKPERPLSVGKVEVTNVRDTGTVGLSSTNWMSSDSKRVYIGRGGFQKLAASPLQNPFAIQAGTTREQIIEKFRRYCWEKINSQNPFNSTMLNLASLLAQGNDLELVCHCKPEACHGDVICSALLWMIQNNKVAVKRDPMTTDISGGRLHIGMIGLKSLVGFTNRMNLEIETVIDNKHRKWFLKLNGEPTRNPVIHVRNSSEGFDKLLRQYLQTERYRDVVIHGEFTGTLPEGWIVSQESFDVAQFHYLFAHWDEQDSEVGDLIKAADTKALIAYERQPNVTLSDPLPSVNDDNRFAKFAAAVSEGAYVAVVGSREFTNTQWASAGVAQFVNALPSSCTLVSGGAKGVDTWAEETAKARGLKTLIHPAYWVQKARRLANGQIDPTWQPQLEPPDRTIEFTNERSAAGVERNKVLVDESNVVFAFMAAKESSGTKDAISYATLKRKIGHIFRENDVSRPTNQDEEFTLGMDLFYFEKPGDFSEFI